MKHFYLIIVLLTFSQTAVPQTCNSRIIASTPDSRFSINGQEVTDTKTGLIWQKCSLGKTGSNCTGSARHLNWEGALQAADIEAQVTGKGWRLPNVKELRSIVEEKCILPAINLAVFPNTISLSNNYSWNYWSASVYTRFSNVVWTVSFRNGYSEPYVKDSKNRRLRVRLVRTR